MPAKNPAISTIRADGGLRSRRRAVGGRNQRRVHACSRSVTCRLNSSSASSIGMPSFRYWINTGSLSPRRYRTCRKVASSLMRERDLRAHTGTTRNRHPFARLLMSSSRSMIRGLLH